MSPTNFFMRRNLLISLLLVQLVASLSLIAFAKLEPVILEVFELSGIRFQLIIFQNLMVMFIPVLIGVILDRYFSKKYFAGISIGAMITLLSLVLLLLLFYGWLGNGTLAWILLSIWFLGIKLFSVFGYGLLDQVTNKNRWPVATVFIAQVIFITYIFSRLLSEIVYRSGPVLVTILLIILVTLSYVFYRVVHQEIIDESKQPLEVTNKTSFGFISIVAVLTGFFQLVITGFMPIWIMGKSNNALHEYGSEFPLTLLLIVSFLSAWPLAALVSKKGIVPSLRLAIAGCFFSLTFIFMVPDMYAALVGLILAGVAFALLFVSGLPYVLVNRHPDNRYMAIALFFSVMEMPGLVLDILRFGK